MTKLGRTMTGYPMRSARVSASSMLWAMPPSGCGMPSRSRSAAKRVRSSAWSIASRSLPRSSTPPAASGPARLSGVWPPNATTAGMSSPSGDSASITERTDSGSSGSKYSRDEASKSVDTVSGFELIITACQPAARNVSAAWTAQ